MNLRTRDEPAHSGGGAGFVKDALLSETRAVGAGIGQATGEDLLDWRQDRCLYAAMGRAHNGSDRWG